MEGILAGTVLRTMDISLSEIGNAVWKQVYLRKTLTREAGELAMENGARVINSLELERTDAASLEALRLGVDLGLPFYDSLYVAAALARGCPLATADKVQARKASGIVEVIEVE